MRLGSSGAYCQGTVMNWILSRPMPLNCAPRSAIFARLSSPVSRVRDWVAASRNCTRRIGLASVLALITWWAIEAMNACCRFIRPMSEPSPTTYRSRT